MNFQVAASSDNTWGGSRKKVTLPGTAVSRKCSRRGGGHVKNLLDYANQLFRQKDYKGSLKYLRKHGAKHISSPQLQLILGKVHSKLGHPKRALEAFQNASDLKPDDPTIVRRYARALQDAGSLKAEDVMYRACQLSGGFNVKNLLMLGNFYRTWGEKYPEYKEMALVCYREASERTNFTGESEVLYNLLYDDLGWHPRTAEMDVIAERMSLLEVRGLKVPTSAAYCCKHQ